MLRSVQAGMRGRGGKAGGKAGKRTLGPAAREILHGALASEAAGDHAAAAEAFVGMARTAESRGRPAAAAHVAVRGALAALQGGDVEQALAIGREGLTLAAGVAEQRRVARKFQPLIGAFEGHEAASGFGDEVKKAFGLKLVPAAGETVKPNRAQRRALPKLCPTCGEPIDRSSVELQDDGSFDCTLCGDAVL